MSTNNNFQPTHSTLGDLQMVCAQLFHVDGEIHNNIKTFSIFDLVKKLKVPESDIDINERVKNALRDIHSYNPKDNQNLIIRSVDNFNTIEMNLTMVEELYKLQSIIATNSMHH